MIPQNVQNWEYIPKNAFLYFPKGQQIKIGKNEKAWRKIFQSGQPYDDYQNSYLQNFETYCKQKRIEIHSSVNKANKLRYLQANKFDIKKTAASLEQYSKWRSRTQFPIKLTQQHRALIQSGAFYFCGRDHNYRPIMVIDIGRFDKNKKDLIPETLVDVMQFMLDELLIQGQVQNYILIMDLQQYSIGLQGIVSEILSFTSNSYRGRLFCNYILEMPTVLSWGWEAFASKFVSENTLRKIKISKGKSQPSMWEHMDKTVIEKKFGGTRQNIKDFHWPPKKQFMTYEPYTPALISSQEYQKMYQMGQLSNRKIHRDLVKIQQIIQQVKPQQIMVDEIKSDRSEAQNKSASHQILLNSGHVPQVKKEKAFNFKVRQFKTFFDTAAYEKIGRKN